MNEDTLVSVHCYAGDAHQVQHFLPSYLQHGCPVVIMSPDDSPVVIPGTESRFAGKRAYIGKDSLDRQRLQMSLLLGYPHKYFLMHDSDSLFLSSQIPDYLYTQSEGVIWSNEVHDWRTHPSPYNPRIALQPPYFLTRETMLRMLEVADKPVIDPITPFIDWYMMALMFEAKLGHRSFVEGVSFGTGDESAASLMVNAVQNEGKYILHSVKLPSVYNRLCSARASYGKRHAKPPTPKPRPADGRFILTKKHHNSH